MGSLTLYFQLLIRCVYVRFRSSGSEVQRFQTLLNLSDIHKKVNDAIPEQLVSMSGSMGPSPMIAQRNPRRESDGQS